MKAFLGLFCVMTAGVALAQNGKLAFAANLSGNWDLFLWEPGSSKPPVQLTRTSIDERSPALSPDGSRIAYITSDGSLWVMDLQKKSSRQLGAPPGHYGYPAWIPDGTGIVYTVYTFQPPSEDADLYLYSFADGKQRLLVKQTGPQDYPSISRYGDLAFMSSISTLVPGFGPTITQQLWTISLRTGKAQQIFAGSARDTSPSWSPDGLRIAFSSDRAGSPEIWIIDAQGSKPPQQMTSGPGSKSSPAFSPDGNLVAFTSNATGKSLLMTVDVKSRELRAVRPFGTKVVEMRDPSWR